MIRILVLAITLSFSVAAPAKDMSTWSDRTMCRLEPELKHDRTFQWHMDQRGLVCTSDGVYREPRYVTQTAMCDNNTLAIEPQAVNEFWAQDYLPQTALTFTSIDKPLLLATADFNTDGLADFLLASSKGYSQLSLLYGQVNGKLQHHPLPALADLAAPVRGAQAADINNDGQMDFIVYAEQGNHWQFTNIGTGFAATKITALGSDNQTLDIELVDLNHDKQLDLIALSSKTNTNKTPFINGPNGFTVGAEIYSPAINAAHTTALTSADFNNDGFVDIAFSEDGTNNQISLLLGDSDLNNRDNQFLLFPKIEQDLSYSHLQSADLNNDGLMDLLHAYTYSIDETIEATSMRAYINQQHCFVDATDALLPNFPQATAQLKSNKAINNIQQLDINHDGLQDLLLQQRQDHSEGVVLLNSGNQYHSINLAAWQGNEQYLSGDINGDQMRDLVALRPLQGNQWQLQAYLHASPLTTPYAPRVPVDFERISDDQKQSLSSFLKDHLFPSISLENALAGTSILASRKNTKVAWHLIPKQAPNEASFLGLDDFSWADDHWQILSEEVYFFYPTRDHRNSLEMHSNRQGQIILRGHMHVTPKERRQNIEIFGHRNNGFAMGVLDKGDLLILEFLP